MTFNLPAMTDAQISAELLILRHKLYLASQSRNAKMTGFYLRDIAKFEKEQDRRRGK